MEYGDSVPLLEEARDACLVWCNDIRAMKKKDPLKKLPKGKLGDPLSCPCGKATGLRVTGCSYYDVDAKDQLVRIADLPPSVRHFIAFFDRGFYPDLIDTK